MLFQCLVSVILMSTNTITTYCTHDIPTPLDSSHKNTQNQIKLRLIRTSKYKVINFLNLSYKKSNQIVDPMSLQCRFSIKNPMSFSSNQIFSYLSNGVSMTSEQCHYNVVIVSF